MCNTYPVLDIKPDVLKELDGGDALTGLWFLFSKCKSSLDNGRRLENISWRLWSREMATSMDDIPNKPKIGKQIYELATHDRYPVSMFLSPYSSQLPTPEEELVSISIIPEAEPEPEADPRLRVVVVNPTPNLTPHPTPPATPVITPASHPFTLSPRARSPIPSALLSLPALPSSSSVSSASTTSMTTSNTSLTSLTTNTSSGSLYADSAGSSGSTKTGAKGPPNSLIVPKVNSPDATLKPSDAQIFFLQQQQQHGGDPRSASSYTTTATTRTTSSDESRDGSGIITTRRRAISRSSRPTSPVPSRSSSASWSSGSASKDLNSRTNSQSHSEKTHRKTQSQSSDDPPVQPPARRQQNLSEHSTRSTYGASKAASRSRSRGRDRGPLMMASSKAKRKINSLASANGIKLTRNTTESQLQTIPQPLPIASLTSRPLSAKFNIGSNSSTRGSRSRSKSDGESSRSPIPSAQSSNIPTNVVQSRSPPQSYGRNNYSNTANGDAIREGNASRGGRGGLSAMMHAQMQMTAVTAEDKGKGREVVAAPPPQTLNALSSQQQQRRTSHPAEPPLLKPLGQVPRPPPGIGLQANLNEAARVGGTGLVRNVGKDGKAKVPSLSGGYRPKGRPQEQEMEEETEEEDEHDNTIQLSKSVAQQKLAALAGRRGIAPSTTTTTNVATVAASAVPGVRFDDLPPWLQDQVPTRRAPVTAPGAFPAPVARPLAVPEPQHPTPSYRPTPTPIQQPPQQLAYPYNLPQYAEPSSPRTTRQLMLRTEMSESLRQNLLWTRQLQKSDVIGPRRKSSGTLDDGGRNLRPLTSILPPVVQLRRKKSASQSGAPPQTAAASGSRRDGEEDSVRAVLSRNKSWADEYHHTGW